VGVLTADVKRGSRVSLYYQLFMFSYYLVTLLKQQTQGGLKPGLRSRAQSRTSARSRAQSRTSARSRAQSRTSARSRPLSLAREGLRSAEGLQSCCQIGCELITSQKYPRIQVGQGQRKLSTACL